VAVDPALASSYETCRRLNARYGRTYYLATLLLPAHKRPAVHALYAFARCADEIVDAERSGASAAERAADLDSWSARLLTDLRSGDSTDPVGRAVVDTIRRWGIPVSLFEDFLASMRMDLTVTRYPAYADLEAYMWGSAAVVGLQMLPVLEPLVPTEDAAPYAVALGQAFQLTNFLRDVGEDLHRGRVYLPEEELAAYGATIRAEGGVDGPFRRLMAFQIDRARALYRCAEPGIGLLHPTSRDCVRTALRLYEGILDEIEAADYDVFGRRATVSRSRRLVVAGPGLVRAVRARRRYRRRTGSTR
jgi:phytoene synthase